MKSFFKFSFVLCFAIGGLNAQIVRPLFEEVWPEADTTLKVYTVKGYRHGVSFFPKVKYPEVEYIPSATLTFDRYHTADVFY